MRIETTTPAALARARERLKTVKGTGQVRSLTLARPYLTREEKADQAALDAEDLDFGPRPQTRADCEEGGSNAARPCPFVSCSHHLALEVTENGRGVKLNFPHLDVDQFKETCALDVADRGGATLEEVGALTNITRERARQIEVRALSKIRRLEPTFDDSPEVPRGNEID